MQSPKDAIQAGFALLSLWDVRRWLAGRRNEWILRVDLAGFDRNKCIT